MIRVSKGERYLGTVEVADVVKTPDGGIDAIFAGTAVDKKAEAEITGALDKAVGRIGEALAEDHASMHGEADHGGKRRSGRTFGISNWGNCTWEPTGRVRPDNTENGPTH